MVNRSKRFKVFIAIAAPCPFPGAGWRRIHGFATALKAKGYDSAVLSAVTPRTVGVPKVVDVRGIRVYNIVPAISSSNALLVALNNLVSFPPVLLFLIITKPDMLLVSVPSGNQLLAFYVSCKVTGTAFAVDYRDEYEDMVGAGRGSSSIAVRGLRSLLRRACKNSSLVTTVTPSVKDSLTLHGVLDAQVVYDGVDLRIFRPGDKGRSRRELGLGEASYVVLYLGNVYHPYRLDIVVDAFKHLLESGKSKDFVLVLAGGGDVPEVVRRARGYGLTRHLKVLGELGETRDVVRVLQAADIGIIPYGGEQTWNRTLSTKLFEYCACGLPVVASVGRPSILAEFINSNRLGSVVPPLDSSSFAEAIRLISEDEVLAQEFRENAMKFAKRFDRAEIGLGLAELVSRVVDTRFDCR